MKTECWFPSRTFVSLVVRAFRLHKKSLTTKDTKVHEGKQLAVEF